MDSKHAVANVMDGQWRFIAHHPKGPLKSATTNWLSIVNECMERPGSFPVTRDPATSGRFRPERDGFSGLNGVFFCLGTLVVANGKMEVQPACLVSHPEGKSPFDPLTMRRAPRYDDRDPWFIRTYPDFAALQEIYDSFRMPAPLK